MEWHKKIYREIPKNYPLKGIVEGYEGVCLVTLSTLLISFLGGQMKFDLSRYHKVK